MDIEASEKLTTGDRVFTFLPFDIERARGDISLIDGPDRVVEAIFLNPRASNVKGEDYLYDIVDASNGAVFDRTWSGLIFASREDAREVVMKAIEDKMKEFTERRNRWLGAEKDTSGETV